MISASGVLALISSYVEAASPPGHYDGAAGLGGGPLKAALHDIVRPHRVIPYGQLHAPLARLHEDPANPANVILLYSADSVPKGSDFNSAVWNREHAWPRSRGNADESGPDDSDLHYIWPCYDAVNSTRGNLPYDLSSITDPGYRAPGHPLAPRTSLDSDSWEPPPGQRGALARCLFYVAVRYDGDEPATSDMELASYAPSGSRMGNLNTLLRWHAEEPVTDAERRRNDLIFSEYQGNRNPFIDHPEWVEAIWGAPLAGTAGTRPIAEVRATVANASEQPRYAGEFTVALSHSAPPGGIRIPFRLAGTTVALLDYDLSGAGVDYDSSKSGGTVLIPAGAASAKIILQPRADSVTEPAETAILLLEPGVSYTVVPNASQFATVTVSDLPVLPARWTFDDGAPFTNPLPAEAGNALLNFTTWRGTTTRFSGVTGDALALVGSAGNGSSIDIVLSMSGQRDLAVDFATRGTATGFTSGTWSWSVDGAVFTPLNAINTASTSATFASRTVSFAGAAVLNNAANVTLRYTLDGASSTSANIRIDDLRLNAFPLSVPPNLPVQIINRSADAEVGAGNPVSFFVHALGQPAPSYQWFKDGQPLAGATHATLTWPFATATDAGRYTVTAANAAGQATSPAIAVNVRPSPSRLINVATRASIAGGDAVLIAGFVVGGDREKTVLIRGVGPALRSFAVSDPLPDPKIELFRGTAKLAENDDWAGDDTGIHASVGAFPLPPGSKDAALVITLSPGAYTAQLRAASGSASGIGLLEVFELPAATATLPASRLINLSTRAFVGTGQNILIPGIVVGAAGTGNAAAARLVLIRAVGPGLADFGVTSPLQRPQLKVLSESGAIIAENIGWQSAASRAALISASERVGAFALSATRADSAVLIALPPMPHTIQVSGADGSSGIALVEVYEVP